MSRIVVLLMVVVVAGCRVVGLDALPCDVSAQCAANEACIDGLCGPPVVSTTPGPSVNVEERAPLLGEGVTERRVVEAVVPLGEGFRERAHEIAVSVPDGCGDGLRAAGEACDDGDATPGDGCFACEVEPGFLCFGDRTRCAPDADVVVVNTADELNSALASASVIRLTPQTTYFSSTGFTTDRTLVIVGDGSARLQTQGDVHTLVLLPGANVELYDVVIEQLGGGTTTVQDGIQVQAGASVAMEHCIVGPVGDDGIVVEAGGSGRITRSLFSGAPDAGLLIRAFDVVVTSSFLVGNGAGARFEEQATGAGFLHNTSAANTIGLTCSVAIDVAYSLVFDNAVTFNGAGCACVDSHADDPSTGCDAARPEFIDPAANDFHIAGGLVCVDDAFGSNEVLDFDGDLRKGIPDIGADEAG